MWIRSATTALSLVGALLARALSAQPAAGVCTAADIVAQDPAHCPDGSGPCTIQSITIDPGCVLDFGSRDVTITGTLGFDGMLTAGDLTVASGGRIIGGIQIVSRGTVTNAGQIEPYTIDAAGDIVSTGRGTFGGRYCTLTAGGNVELGGPIDVSDDGPAGYGSVEIYAGQQVILHRIRAHGTGASSLGGSIEINAGTSVQLLGEVELQGGNDDGREGWGGPGGRLSARASYGDLLVAADIDASGGRPGNYGGAIELSASGTLSVQNAKFNVRTYDSPDSVGYVGLDAGQSLAFNGYIDASAGNIGGEVEMRAGGAITLSGAIYANARGIYGEGGIVTVAGSGNVTVDATIDATSATSCNDYACGYGGCIEVKGCAVTIAAPLKAGAAEGGQIFLTSREQLTITSSGSVNAADMVALDGPDPIDDEDVIGVVEIGFPTAKPPIGLNAVVPPPSLYPGDVTPCPACGNGRVEPSETCDDGNTASCDGCSISCQTEDCDDGKICTTDSCTERLGCLNSGIPGCIEPPTPASTPDVTPAADASSTPTRTRETTRTATQVPTASPTPTRSANSVCAAADVSWQDPADCPDGSAPCIIAKSLAVADHCVLDFGRRAVTITGGLDINSGSVSLRAGRLTIAPGGLIDGRGDGLGGATDSGGHITVETTGDVTIEETNHVRGRIDVSGNFEAGTVEIVAAGTITNAGRVEANSLSDHGRGGDMTIRAARDIVGMTRGVFSARGGVLDGGGGDIHCEAAGEIGLDSTIDVSGADVRRRGGGHVSLRSGGPVSVHDILANGIGNHAAAGTVDIIGGTSVHLLGHVELQGGDGPGDDYSVGGLGGSLDVAARYGDLLVAAPIDAMGGRPNGFGGMITLRARGAVDVPSTQLNVSGDGNDGLVGEVVITAGLSVTFGGSIDANGGNQYDAEVALRAGTAMTMAGTIVAHDPMPYFPSGNVDLSAGREGGGGLTVSGVVDVSGADVPDRDCDAACGVITVTGCAVDLTGQLRASSSGGGYIRVESREQLTISSSARVDASGKGGGAILIFPKSKPPVGLSGVSPTAMLFASETLPGCPVCGNHRVEFPETCDDGNTMGCDGCSSLCKREHCDDGDACTTDSCTPRLGCLNIPVSLPCSGAPTAIGTITPTATQGGSSTRTPTASGQSSRTPTPAPTATRTSSPTATPGILDGNCDQRLSAADLTAIVMRLGEQAGACGSADVNQDGVVDEADLAAAILREFNTSGQ